MSDLLDIGYLRCAELTKRYGTTYYWGARLLPVVQRRDVCTVYALCRLADDIVDEPERDNSAVPREGTAPERLEAFRRQFFTALARGTSAEPVMAAVVDSIRRRGTDPDCFERFFDAMAADLTRTTCSAIRSRQAGVTRRRAGSASCRARSAWGR